MKVIAGVDEAGRGSLIGPVYASAVILKKSINPKLLKDSKSLSKKKERVSMYIYKKKFYLVHRQSFCQRNRKAEYTTGKFAGYEKSYQKT